MRSRSEHETLVDPSTDRDLLLLTEVEATPAITQRELSRRVGIALGLTNVLLRNLAQKGYVRVTKAGWKRWLYNLTPEGFSHKARLTVAYIHRVLDHYQMIRQTLRAQMETLSLNEESRVAIYGTGEFAELVYLGLKEFGIAEIDIYDSGTPSSRSFLGVPVRGIATLEVDKYDRVVLASLEKAEARRVTLEELGAAPEKLVTFFTDGPMGEND